MDGLGNASPLTPWRSVAQPVQQGFRVTLVQSCLADVVVVFGDVAQVKAVLLEQIAGVGGAEIAVAVGTIQNLGPE